MNKQYRFLNQDEDIQEGDEFAFISSGNGWANKLHWGPVGGLVGSSPSSHGTAFFRRPVQVDENFWPAEGPPPVEVVIDRKKWQRGYRFGPSSGLLYDGRMCCLGFASKVLGATEEEMDKKCYPSRLDRVLPGLTRRLNPGESLNIFDPTGNEVTNTQFSSDAAVINDDEDIDDTEREAKLTELAAANGFKFVFVN